MVNESRDIEVVDLGTRPELTRQVRDLISEFLLLGDSWVVLLGLTQDGALPDYLVAELDALPGLTSGTTGMVAVATIKNQACGTGQIRPFRESQHDEKAVEIPPGLCELKRMYVPSTYQRRGVGKLIVQFLTEKALDLGFREMYLDVTSNRQGSIEFYESLGFQPCRARHDYSHSVVSMSKVLGR